MAHSPVHLALVVVVAVSVALLLLAERRAWPLLRGAAKSSGALGFVALGIAGSPWTQGGAVFAVFVGLVLCALGDLLLIPRGAGKLFVLGLVAFLCGHLAYAFAFATAAPAPIPVALAALAFGLPAAFIAQWLLARAPAKLKVPIAAYIVVVTMMAAIASARALSGASWGLALAGAATAFWISDLFVARQRFGAPSFSNKLIGLPLYFGAQVVFALWITIELSSEAP